jgi:hypothetical protein
VPVRLRRRRAGEPRRGEAVPDGRRERQRLLRLAARDPRHPGPGRGGSRAARPCRPHLLGPPTGLRRAAHPRRAAPGGPAPLAPARGAADARDGPLRPPGATPAAPHHRQPARPPGRPEPARPRFAPSGRTRSAGRRQSTCRPARAGSTWPRSRTWPRARSSAGAWPTTSGPGCASTPW